MNQIITNESTVTSRPPFKTDKTDTGIGLTVALPGVSKENLGVNAEGQLLTITGERSNPGGDDSHEARRYELKLQLHEDLDTNKITAKYQNGVLTLGLQKREELAPKKINILAN
ncbi:MAG: Hsp20/alpha crystallin family protein [Akkermansiaceae bacterium]|nr:Hsp20/alpha crystallin family protein [Akkermansiaceae bacterium]MDG2322497.1 Hsp20/alpha crystallin family protein [Akkermansiaceae bacterium]